MHEKPERPKALVGATDVAVATFLLKQNSQNSCRSVTGFPIECRFHPCRNSAGGCGIGGIGGTGGAHGARTSIAEEAWERAGRLTG